MPHTYVNVPGTGTGSDTDPLRPDIDTSAITRYGGNRLANSGRWVGRVEGTQSALDGLVGRSDVEELSADDAMAQLNAGAPTTLTSDSRLFA